MTTYTLTVTAQQLEIIRDATELLSRIAGGQVEEVLRYAPISHADYWEARGAMLRALGPYKSQDYYRVIIDNGSWDIYQVARHRLAWDRKLEGDPSCLHFDEPVQHGSEPLPIVSTVEGPPQPDTAAPKNHGKINTSKE